MGEILSSYGQCDAAPSGEVAILLFKDAHNDGMPYGLITMDIEMPRMNGQEVVNKLRAIEQEMGIKGGKEAKILMVTSRSELDMVSTSYYEGCNGYLNKPPTREKIKKAIDELGIV